jgi:hypothetical protein
MRWQHLLLIIAYVGFSASASAEFYRYTDENGVVYFTDNYIEIPAKYQSGAKTLSGSSGTPAPPPQAGVDADRASVDKQAVSAIRPEEPDADKAAVESLSPAKTSDQAEALNRNKAKLDQLGADLQKEKAVLEKVIVSTTDMAQAKAHRNKVIKFNQRIAEYRKQLADFNKKVEAYNRAARK